jgi:hypothetical protein
VGAMTDEKAETLEAPGRFELPNEGFADGSGTATGGRAPAIPGGSEAPAGLGRPGEVGASRARSGARDPAWCRRATLARWGTLADRFWPRVNKRGRTMPGMDTPCWEWTKALDDDGYGRLEAGGKKHAGAHRVAWELVHGAPPPDDRMVCHRCDNPRCVRAETEGGHLFLGTQRDNVRDALAKGRHGSLKQAGKKRGPYRKRAA